MAASGHQTDMRRYHAPALRRPHPGLALASYARAAFALEFQVRGGEVLAIGGDDGAHDLSCKTLRGTLCAEGADLVVTVEVLAGAVTQGVSAVPEQGVEHLHVVGNQRGFLAFNRGRDFGQDVG